MRRSIRLIYTRANQFVWVLNDCCRPPALFTTTVRQWSSSSDSDDMEVAMRQRILGDRGDTTKVAPRGKRSARATAVDGNAVDGLDVPVSYRPNVRFLVSFPASWENFFGPIDDAIIRRVQVIYVVFTLLVGRLLPMMMSASHRQPHPTPPSAAHLLLLDDRSCFRATPSCFRFWEW